MTPTPLHRFYCYRQAQIAMDRAKAAPEPLQGPLIDRAAAWESVARARDFQPGDLPRFLAGRGRRVPEEFAAVATDAENVLARAGQSREWTFTGNLDGVPFGWTDFLARHRGQKVTLHFRDADGGDLDAALAVLNHLELEATNGTKILAFARGSVCSAHADIFALCPGIRVAWPDAHLMLHEVTTTVLYGNAQTLKEAAARLESNHRLLSSALQSRTGQPADVVGSWLGVTPKYFSATKCVELGLADRVGTFFSVMNL